MEKKSSRTKIINNSKDIVNDKKNNFLKKALIFLFSISIIVLLVIVIIQDRFNINNFLLDVEKQTGLSIKLNGQTSWHVYPQIYFSNPDTKISHNNSSFFINKGNIIINKSYWLFSPFYIDLKSPLINLNGIELKNSDIQAVYKNKTITFNKFTGNLVDGKIEMKGKINLEEEMPFKINGKFNNISLNTLFQQSGIAVWDRLSVKLSSNKFDINGYAQNKDKFINSLNGNANILGSAYLMTTDEERFGAALLSLLVEKLPTITSMSKSVNFILSTYGNIPTSINGHLIIKDGIIESNNIDIRNDFGKSSMNASLNLRNNNINGSILFYKDDEIFLEAFLQGNVANPEVLVGGKVFRQNNEDVPRDIKKIFEEGINSLVDKLLQINE